MKNLNIKYYLTAYINFERIQNLLIKYFEIYIILKYIDIIVFVEYNRGIVYNCNNFSNMTYSVKRIGWIIGFNRAIIKK